MKAALVQTLIRAIYPPQCLMCDARTTEEFGLCGACWAQTPFITGTCCDGCGSPLPAGDGGPEANPICDDCLRTARPWRSGRAVMSYDSLGRRIVMALKHGDRLELARAAAPWLQRTAQPIWDDDVLLVPIPLHPARLIRRRYNQSALLAQRLAERTGAEVLPDALVRVRKTAPLEGHSRTERFEALDGAIAAHPLRGAALTGRKVLLIDDVMTSGATFDAATQAALAAGATRVSVLSLARVHKPS